MALSDLSIRELLREVAPETQGAEDLTLDIFIEIATLRISPTVFGNLYRVAVAYLAAHFYVLSQERGGVAGPLTSARAGEVAESYGRLRDDPAGYNATTYGNLYLELRRSRYKVKPMSTFLGSNN
jgi:hypothetical protein